MRNLLLLLALTMFGCPCHQTGVVYPTTACAEGSSTCLEGRPYACGGGVWRPIGTVASCTAVGGVCCVDRASRVHACVTQDRCADPVEPGGH